MFLSCFFYFVVFIVNLFLFYVNKNIKNDDGLFLSLMLMIFSVIGIVINLRAENVDGEE